MVFNSHVFLFAFLPALFALFWLTKTRQHRYVLLTLSGYVFYGYWNWRFCFLLLFSSLVSFGVALLIERAPTAGGRRGWMIAAIAVDLSILGFFKYYNFFASTFRSLSPAVAPPPLDIVLPIGISFYTFHTISYIVDVATGRVRAARNLFEYLTYVSLFSQLVAGPIVRFRQIEEDLERIDRGPREDFMARGIGFFVAGLIKKVVVADQIAELVNPLLAAHASLSASAAWLAALGYTLQLYYDFSGYSDMAVGLGYLFGIRIPQNFNAPYRAASVADFWRRWHMSLSSWLRDYLYIPLGGNRRDPARTNVNLMVTMGLGGLWHGANWTFVVWGLYHGVLLAVERLVGTRWRPWPEPLARARTFLLVVVGWVLFRSETLPMAFGWLGKLVGYGAGGEGASAALLGWVILGLVAVNTLPETWDVSFGVRPRWAVVYALGFVAAYCFMNGRQSVFLYYQF
jgi:alginate O-acetyltransferase complex protein AlgI